LVLSAGVKLKCKKRIKIGVIIEYFGEIVAAA
jgi:hypothetical protein